MHIINDRIFCKVIEKPTQNTMLIENSTHQNSETALFWDMSNIELEDCRAIVESEVEIKNPYAASKTIEHKKERTK